MRNVGKWVLIYLGCAIFGVAWASFCAKTSHGADSQSRWWAAADGGFPGVLQYGIGQDVWILDDFGVRRKVSLADLSQEDRDYITRYAALAAAGKARNADQQARHDQRRLVQRQRGKEKSYRIRNAKQFYAQRRNYRRAVRSALTEMAVYRGLAAVRHGWLGLQIAAQNSRRPIMRPRRDPVIRIRVEGT